MVKIKKGTFILALGNQSLDEAVRGYTAINDEHWGFPSLSDAVAGCVVDEFQVYDSNGDVVYGQRLLHCQQKHEYSKETHRLMTPLELMAKYPKSFFNDRGELIYDKKKNKYILNNMLQFLGNWHPGFAPELYVEMVGS